MSATWPGVDIPIWRSRIADLCVSVVISVNRSAWWWNSAVLAVALASSATADEVDGAQSILVLQDRADAEQRRFFVSTHTACPLGRNGAITALSIAERLAAGLGDDDPFVRSWHEELNP
jgi:hypothetical protein